MIGEKVSGEVFTVIRDLKDTNPASDAAGQDRTRVVVAIEGLREILRAQSRSSRVRSTRSESSIEANGAKASRGLKDSSYLSAARNPAKN